MLHSIAVTQDFLLITLFFRSYVECSLWCQHQYQFAGEKLLSYYYLSLTRMCTTQTHTLTSFVCKCACKRKPKCLLFLSAVIVAKIKVFSPQQIRLHLKQILQRYMVALFILDRCKEVSLNFCQRSKELMMQNRFMGHVLSARTLPVIHHPNPKPFSE